MGRDVLTLRLSDAERQALEEAARQERVTLSEFLRRAALAVAFRLKMEVEVKAELREPEPEPEPVPVLGRREPHYFASYPSFEAYRDSSPWRVPGGGVIPMGPGARDV
jgi:hypothetical protein